MMETKKCIIEEIKKVKRDGINDLISFLEKSGFFIVPASSKFHGCCEGGLAKHSYSVFKLFKEKNNMFDLKIQEETIILVGLLHDLCKCEIYEKIGNNPTNIIVSS